MSAITITYVGYLRCNTSQETYRRVYYKKEQTKTYNLLNCVTKFGLVSTPTILLSTRKIKCVAKLLNFAHKGQEVPQHLILLFILRQKETDFS